MHDYGMDRYQKIEKNGNMGEGTYGVVYKAKDRLTDKFVAMKVFCAFNITTFNHQQRKFALRQTTKVFPAQRCVKCQLFVNSNTPTLSSEFVTF